MKCDICNDRMELEDVIPVSTAQKFNQEPFEYLALVCEDCVEDYFQLELEY
jgi:hypothetical protein